jgi:drug/metabolite transporter (DMT)-like permease
MNPYAPPTAAYQPPAGTIAPERAAELKKKLTGLNSLSLLIGVSGLILQGVGKVVVGDSLGDLLSVAGIALFVVGLVYYTRARGQHAAFAAFGLLSCLGLFILYFLPKRCLNCDAKHSFSAKACNRCGAPLAQ